MTSADKASPCGELEARSYYFGLPSSPILVYRTGAPWKRPSGVWFHRVSKEARPVFDHPITDAWDELGPQVPRFLDSVNVTWTSIDVVRFASENEGPGPPVLWIGVKPESLTREHAKVAVAGCEELLQQFNLTDVEVGFRESLFARSAGPKLLKHVSPFHGTVDVRRPLTPALGLQIAAQATPHTGGIGALYIRESSHSKRVFVLTARHVVLPPNAEPNEFYVREKNYRRRDVIFFGSKAFQDFLESIMVKIGENASRVNHYNDRLKELASNGNEDHDEDAIKNLKRAILEGELQEPEKALDILNEFHSEVTKHWSAESQRILGHIAYSPPISVHTTKCFREDWALIEVDSEKIDWKNFKGNVMDLGTTKMSDFSMKMHSNYAAPWSFIYPHDGLFPLHGVAKGERLRHPTMLDENGDGCTLVIKNSTSTGATIGRASGMMSFVREYLPNGDHETSRELAIYPYGYNSGAFSSPGDSGAIIADHEGRILGLLSGGTGDGDAVDITYATPFHWLFDECIKKQFPDACLY